MSKMLLIAGLIILLCIMSGKFFYKYGVPLLLVFMGLGMFFGTDGFIGIPFNDYNLAKELCGLGLVFIMFYGGFGTNWKAAKPVAVPSVLLSTVGVVITALAVGLFSQWAFHLSLLEGMLIGAVIASTDAASVFSILRSRKLNLKDNLASLLEIESGSNDPFAYLMTVMIISAMKGSQTSILSLVFNQVFFGVLVGVMVAMISAYILRKVVFEIDGLYPVFVLASALVAFSLAEYLAGNGYLSVYLLGIILGNSKIIHKRSLVHFFDGISWLMQILLFFALGLLVFPSHLPMVIFKGLSIALFLTFIARPLAVTLVLKPFGYSFKKIALVSWVGLRGAASVVFAIYAVSSGVNLSQDLLHIVFLVALMSVGLQGTLLARIAKRLDLVEDDNSDAVLRTFTDYRDEFLSKVMEFTVKENQPWAGKSIMEAEIPESILVLMVKRNDEYILPKGYTELQPNDILLLSGNRIEKDLQSIGIFNP